MIHKSLCASDMARLFGIGLVAFCVLPRMLSDGFAQTTPATAPSAATQPSPPEERVLDKNLSGLDRVTAMQELLAEPPTRRHAGLWILVKSDDEENGPLAAIQLIRENAMQPAAQLLAAMKHWKPNAQGFFLQRALYDRRSVRSNGVVLSLARWYLGEGETWWLATSRRGILPVDSAAMLLALADNHMDRALLRTVARVRSGSPNCWIALAQAGAVDDASAAVARKVYLDPKANLRDRIAAAVAAATQGDPAAANFAVDQIHLLIENYANKDVLRWTQEAWASGRPADAHAVAIFTENAPVVSWLRFLSTKAARDLVASSLVVKNMVIRMAAGMAAAERWPELLLDKRPAPMINEEYRNLLCLVVDRHPELRAQVEANLSPGELKAGLHQIETGGPTAVVGPPGALLVRY